VQPAQRKRSPLPTHGIEAQANTMSTPDTDKVFSGSISKLYETYLVPLIFGPYAADLVNRLASRSVTRVLEIAAGTGVVTRALASVLPERVAIVATDLNQPMLDEASTLGTERPVEWRQADAMQLPFGDGTFDAVVCQFGVMFFPDKSKAFSEARRVLRPGGVFIFNVWDRIEENEFADTVTTALESLFPEDPPRFLARTPHGYYDRPTLERDLANGGFVASAQITTVAARSRAKSSRVPAIAYCQGTPLRNEIEARDASRLGQATDIAAEAIARRFGREDVDGKIQAHMVTIES
jgi:ubiquinone/menaquinone biosynthesis C-methylase UbiE